MESFCSFTTEQRENYDKASYFGGYYVHWNISLDVF